MAHAYTIQQIVSSTRGQLHGNPPGGLNIYSILTDSRRLSFPDYTVFFALVSFKNNGHNYIDSLAHRGVRCFVVSQMPQNKKWLNSCAFILVDDTLNALQQLAGHHRQRFSCPVLGITGSNGKTIVKEWLAQLLSDKVAVVKNPRSYNSQIGVPLSVWQMDDSCQLAIFEAGISRVGEMERLHEIIQPQLGIFTNIGPAHDEGFKTTRQKILEKLKLFESSSLLIYRSDNDELHKTIRQWALGLPNVQLFSWGEEPHNVLQLIARKKIQDGYHIELRFKGQNYLYALPFSDEASLENALHCIAFLHARGYSNGWVAARLTQLQPLAMRLELKQAINNCSLINDSYSSDFLSLSIALDFLLTQVQHKDKVLVLSDILQSGMDEARLYSQVAELVKEKQVHKLIAIGPQINAHKDYFQELDTHFYEDTQEFLSDFDFSTLRDKAILLKGARDFGFERISHKLQLKDHQTLLEIDLDAMVHNLNVYKSMLRSGVKLMAMVKAFSYGSGSYEIANVLQYHQVDYLAVAFADEGNELRKAGVQTPIMVLNPELHNLESLFHNKLEPEIYSHSLLERVAMEVLKFPEYSADNPFPVHLKLDTGMHRLGFMAGELDTLIETLNNHPALKVASSFSHLAGSDKPEFDDFTREQISVFEKMICHLSGGLGYDFPGHIANSTAIHRFPEAQMDMVRLGIGLYGVDGGKDVQPLLKNVTTFKSVVSQVKQVPGGETVGYNRSGKTERDTTIAIVPVGYADGFSRQLGNGKGKLLINGRLVPTIGDVSMDMCAVDVTGLGVVPGDEVIIFGKELPVDILAQQLGTIPYEIFTSIANRVKRVYYKE